MRRRPLALGAVAVVAVVAVMAVAADRRGEPPGRSVAVGTTAGRIAGTSIPTSGTAATTATEPPADPEGPPVPPGPAPGPPRFPTTVAVATGAETAVHDAPGGRVVEVLRSPAPYSGMPQVFVATDVPGPPGWLHVARRGRPNGATGWIRTGDVVLDRHAWSIDIDLAGRWATVYDGPDVFVSTPVVIGTPASPTPQGEFYIVEAVWTGSPNGAYGPFIYGLSAHSDVYTEFGGGDGQIGLHGTNQPGLLGGAASAGCVRFPNDVMLRMARALPMGVPVRVHHRTAA